MSNINIFRHYSQAENRYTNGLISLLKAGSIVDPFFLAKFFEILAGVKLSKNLNFKVLREFNGTADAELSSEDSIILLETKIISGTLRKEQIKRHLAALNKYRQKIKKLILLTPDSIGSHYINQFLKIEPNQITHINWNSAIQFLKEYKTKDLLFSELVKEYIEEVKEEIFEQDISSVIVKISFGNNSGVYLEDYLEEFKNGEWTNWHTPKKYNELDGKGKKLILYDKNLGEERIFLGKIAKRSFRTAKFLLNTPPVTKFWRISFRKVKFPFQINSTAWSVYVRSTGEFRSFKLVRALENIYLGEFCLYPSIFLLGKHNHLIT